MSKELPKELRQELSGYKASGREYSARDLVLAYMANAAEPVTTNELLIYVYAIKKQVVKRTYLYQMMYKLRKAGFITDSVYMKRRTKTGRANNENVFGITAEGRAEARPYVEVRS